MINENMTPFNRTIVNFIQSFNSQWFYNFKTRKITLVASGFSMSSQAPLAERDMIINIKITLQT